MLVVATKFSSTEHSFTHFSILFTASSQTAEVLVTFSSVSFTHLVQRIFSFFSSLSFPPLSLSLSFVIPTTLYAISSDEQNIFSFCFIFYPF